jgi:5-formyltetrahydrofolate cyclo-ligase
MRSNIEEFPAKSSLSSAEEKVALRMRMRALREGQPPALAELNSLKAQARLTATPCWKNAKIVVLYSAFRGEVSVDGLMEQAQREGRDVYLPRMRRQYSGCMEFALCVNPAELVTSAFGLREPAQSLPGFGVEDVDNGFCPDLFVVPGLAFDRRGMRLGFGGGYYDRFLRHLADCPTVGICFEFQLVGKLPVDNWDCPVRYICTEKDFWQARFDSR